MTPVSAEITIGIDIGTTSVKAVVAGDDGRVQARVRIPHQLRVPEPDRFEHDAARAWRQGPLTALARLDRPDVAAVAVAAMVPSLTAVDAAGRPLTPGLLYGDARGRTTTVDAVPTALPPAGEAAEFVRWAAAEAPGAAGYWPAPAVANYALAGQAVIDFGTAYASLPLFDGTAWSETACAERGATAAQMPAVAGTGTPVGNIAGTGAVLAVGAVDAMCEQLVAGADHDGDVLVLCGTTLIVWVTVPGAPSVPGLWTIPHPTPGKSRIGGTSNAGGLFLDWLDRVLGPGDPPRDRAKADPRRVPVWAPYLRGERSPLHDPDRRGVLDGVDLTHDAASLRRAGYEASGFVVRRLIELSGAPVSRVIATGGGTRVRPWMQAIADATGRPVRLSSAADGAALGAAFVARLAVGLETSMTDAARWAATGHVVDPDPAWADAMEDRYARFLELAAVR